MDCIVESINGPSSGPLGAYGRTQKIEEIEPDAALLRLAQALREEGYQFTRFNMAATGKAWYGCRRCIIDFSSTRHTRQLMPARYFLVRTHTVLRRH